MLYKLFKYTLLNTLIALALLNCSSAPIADSDAKHVVSAMQGMPQIQAYLARTNFYPVVNNKGLTKINSTGSRSLKTITYSEKEMLTLAAHASMFRWFKDQTTDEEIPILNIHARIYKLDHSIIVDKGRMQPKAKTKLEIYLTDENNNRIYESFFTTEAIGVHEDFFLNKHEMQDIYGYTIYKTLVEAFELAFSDITDTLNLQTARIDVDDLKIEVE